MGRPSLLLMDEASLGLSPILIKEIFGITKRINEEQKTAILMVEQNAKIALSVARFGYVLELGRMVMADTCEELLQNEDVKEFYLGVKGESVRGQKRWKRKKKWR
jgi:branched-chain amino acid transport system ATP-binding protein